MGMKYAEEPLNMRMFFSPKASLKMGSFSDPQPQEGDSTPGLPRCVGSNWREMGSFLARREGNGVPLYGFTFRGFTPVWVCF